MDVLGDVIFLSSGVWFFIWMYGYMRERRYKVIYFSLVEVFYGVVMRFR